MKAEFPAGVSVKLVAVPASNPSSNPPIKIRRKVER
jgi:hypothetical protein